MSSTSDVTQILQRIQSGDPEATPQLLTVVYGELCAMAHALMQRERQGHTLQPTALVHEAYFRLVGDVETPWENRAHFFGAAASAMRQILVQYARRHRTQKRGGQFKRISLEQEPVTVEDHAESVLVVDEALEKLMAVDPRRGRLVELRFFGGLSLEEIAGILNLSLRTIKREWSCAKAWLYRQMQG